MKRDLNRVVFYSKHDLSGDNNLQNSEAVIESFNPEKNYEINDILELYHIKLYFDNALYRNVWTEETKEKYKQTVSLFWNAITSFFIGINSKNIATYFDTIDYQYYDSFWSLISQLNIYKKIPSDNLNEIFKNSRFHIRQLLKQKKIVNHFSTIIREYLISF